MLSLEHLVVVRPQSSTSVAPIDLKLVNIEQFNRYALEKEITRLACAQVLDAHRPLYEENLQLYQLYSTSPSPDRNRRMFELDIQLLFQRDVQGLHQLLEKHLKRYLDDLLPLRRQYPYYFKE